MFGPVDSGKEERVRLALDFEACQSITVDDLVHSNLNKQKGRKSERGPIPIFTIAAVKNKLRHVRKLHGRPTAVYTRHYELHSRASM